MSETAWIVAALGGLAAVFKGKEVWEFLKHIYDNKKKDEEIAVLKKRLSDVEKKYKAAEKSNTRLKKLLK